MSKSEQPHMAPYQAYRILFAAVMGEEKGGLKILAERISNSTTRRDCRVSVRSLQYYQKKPAGNKRARKARDSRNEYVYLWLARELQAQGKSSEFAKYLEAIAPPDVGPEERAINIGLLTDPLVGVSFSDRGSEKEWDYGFEQAQAQLSHEPENTYLRAILVWSTLMRGNPHQVTKIVRETAKWLSSARFYEKPAYIATRKKLWLAKLEGIRSGTVEDPSFVRTVLEDTIVRQSFLRWLKTEGRNSTIRKRIDTITSGLPFPVTKLFELAESRNKKNWVAEAIKEVRIWISAEHYMGLPKIFLIWLTGRHSEARNDIPKVMNLAFDWLESNKRKNDTIVRWGIIWIGGMSEDKRYVLRIFNEMRKWLNSEFGHDDHLVRLAFLWYVGAKGNSKQVREVMTDTEKWLRRVPNRNSTTILLARLFCLRHAVERGEAQPKWLDETIARTKRLKKDFIIELGISLAQCSLPIGY